MDRKQNLKPWPKGVSGNPGDRPKQDLAAQIARAVFESDPEGITKAMLAGLLRGNPRLFTVLSERGYGKLTEHLTIDATVSATGAERLARARARRIIPAQSGCDQNLGYGEGLDEAAVL